MSGAIPCHDAVRKLWDYLDGGVDDDQRSRIDEHLTFCLRCCGELEFARELRGLLQDRRSAPIPSPTLARLESFIDDLEPPPPDQGQRGRGAPTEPDTHPGGPT